MSNVKLHISKRGKTFRKFVSTQNVIRTALSHSVACKFRLYILFDPQELSCTLVNVAESCLMSPNVNIYLPNCTCCISNTKQKHTF